MIDEKRLCCPKCKLRFSDWFIWGALRYCYPCYNFGVGKGGFITEEEGILLPDQKEN